MHCDWHCNLFDYVVKLYGFCLSIAYVAHSYHPYIESLPTLWYYTSWHRNQGGNGRAMTSPPPFQFYSTGGIQPPSLPSISIDRSLSIFTQLAFFAFFDLNHRFDHWLNSAIIQTLQSSNCLSLQCALVYPESRTWKFRAAQWHELIIFIGLIWLVRSCLAANYNHCTKRSILVGVLAQKWPQKQSCISDQTPPTISYLPQIVAAQSGASSKINTTLE